MMSIYLNDKLILAEKNSPLSALLKKYVQGDYYAVAVNSHVIPRSQHDNTILQENDVIDIVTPMQGG